MFTYAQISFKKMTINATLVIIETITLIWSLFIAFCDANPIIQRSCHHCARVYLFEKPFDKESSYLTQN